MSEQPSTFVDRCLAGEALLEEIDDYVDRWHASGGSGQSLAAYLGFTPDEYALWVEQPQALNYVI